MQRKLEAATILDHEEHDGKMIPVIATIRVSGPYTQHPGLLVFKCPQCGKTHTHGACSPNFGAGDGDRVVHCPPPHKENGYDMYILREVHDASLAGGLPYRILKDQLPLVA